MHFFRFVMLCVQDKGGILGRRPEVLDAMGDDDAVEELFKTDPLQEGLALPPLERREPVAV